MKRALFAALLLASPLAHAQSKRECADAYTSAQVLRRNGKLLDAKAQLEICNETACPAALRTDCGPWLAQVTRAIPSITVDASPSGARVTLDGQPVASGRASPVDPGEHTIAVEGPGLVSDSRTVTVAAGDARTIAVALRSAVAMQPAPPAPEPHARVPIAPIVLGAVGLAFVGAFAGFGAAGLGARSDLDASGCKPDCDPSKVDAIKTDYVVADVALGLGLASIATAVVLFFVLPHAAPARASGALGSFGLAATF